MDSLAPKINLLNLDRAGLDQFFAALGEKRFRTDQVLQWIHARGVDDFELMTNLNKPLRQRLADLAEIRAPEVVTAQVSQDGTHKWLLRVDAKNCIETVFIPESDRGTLCISSQVGCALNCSFCSTAQQGFSKNLSVAEMIGQVWLASRLLAQHHQSSERIISNVVLMGMGEPLLNLDAVIPTLGLLLDDMAYGLSKRRLTLSTSGVVPGLERLATVSDVSLAVSLHAPDNELRSQLVPINKKYPIEQLLVACQNYLGEGRRCITFEYTLLAGINDSPQQARALIKLLRNIPAKVNLIPFNPFPNSQYQCSSPAVMEQFKQILQEAGMITITRKTRGEDIDAACGQLVGRVNARGKRYAVPVIPVI